jgi:hypothetical protein
LAKAEKNRTKTKKQIGHYKAVFLTGIKQRELPYHASSGRLNRFSLVVLNPLVF